MQIDQKKCVYCNSTKIKLRTKIINKERHFLVPGVKDLDRKWYNCNDCKVCFSVPRLNKKDIDYMYANYRSESFRGETPDEYFDRITNYSPEESENHQKVQWIINNINKEWNPSKIIDIGCGGGVLLDTLRRSFEKASLYGIEPTESYAQLASRRTGAKINNGYFHKKSFPNCIFNLITCCQVLEHIDDLKMFVSDLKKITDKSSFIYIEVPDIRDFDKLPLNHFIFSEPSHLWYFSSEFLDPFFISNGFDILCCEVITTIRNRNDLRYLLKKL